MKENAQASALLDGVRDGLATAAASSLTPAVPPAMGDMAAVNQAATAIARTPEFQHITSSEPWYQKRSRWSAIISAVVVVAAPLLAYFGMGDMLTPERQELIVTLCTTLGGIWAGWLAYRAGTATKPLGR